MRNCATRWILGLAICSLPGIAAAQAARPPYLTILPERPAAGELVVLRHDVAACIFQEVFVAPTGPQSVRVSIYTSDTCAGSRPARVAFHELGRFPAGVVQIEYVECSGLPPPPFPLCNVSTESLVIGGGEPRAVPAGGALAAGLLAMLLMLAGLPRSSGSAA